MRKEARYIMRMKWIFLTLAIVVMGIPFIVHALEVGDRAPLFEAPSTQGTIRLADYQGKKHVVLAFYFADFTPV